MSSVTVPTKSPYAALAHALRAATTRCQAQTAFERAQQQARRQAPQPPSAPGDSAIARARPTVETIGIWQRRTIDGETWFVRESGGDPRTHVLWANVDRIGPKRHRKRVLLLGESCARGWPYDPLFNCATVLRAQLSAVPGGDQVELVDLAHAGIGPVQLIELTAAARALDPDILVIFAGNNWAATTRHLDLRVMAETLRRTRSWRAVAEHCEEIVRRRLALAFDDLAAACGGVPTMFVIPAENMIEHECPSHVCNPLLASHQQVRRDELIAAIDRACAEGDFPRVERLGNELLVLEDHVGSHAHQALALCALVRGDMASAVRLFGLARESHVHLPVFGLNSYTNRTEELRAGAARHGMTSVDLPECLLDENRRQPLGHDLFIDNVHLTAKGIRVAMAATAERLLPMLALPTRSRQELIAAAAPLEVPAEAHAQAHFVAATTSVLHDAWTMRYHFAKAVEHAPSSLDVIRDFAEVALTREPYVFAEALDRLTSRQAVFPVLRGLGAMPTRSILPFDYSLAHATSTIVAEVDPDGARHYVDLFHRRHAIRAGETDLLPYAVFDDFACMIRGAFLQCFRRQTTFQVTCGPSITPTRLRLATRTEHAGPPTRTATLAINGVVVHSWLVGRAWARTACAVDPDRWQIGPNAVTITWPEPEGDDDRVEYVASALERLARVEPVHPEVMTNIYAFFGHITYGAVSGFVASTLPERRGERLVSLP